MLLIPVYRIMKIQPLFLPYAKSRYPWETDDRKCHLCVMLPFIYLWRFLLSGCTLFLASAHAPFPCIKEGCLIAVSVSLLALHILQYMPSDYSSTQPSMKTAAVHRFRRTALGQWYYMTCWQEKLYAHERPWKPCIRKHGNPRGLSLDNLRFTLVFLSPLNYLKLGIYCRTPSYTQKWIRLGLKERLL